MPPNDLASKLPCARQAAELREAIDEWVTASEATRKYLISAPIDATEELAPLHPGFFREMQQAYERERKARLLYIKANNALYDCMDKHGLID